MTVTAWNTAQSHSGFVYVTVSRSGETRSLKFAEVQSGISVDLLTSMTGPKSDLYVTIRKKVMAVVSTDISDTS